MTQSNINLPKQGPDAVFTLAMLQDLQAMPNRIGDTRQGANNTGLGKQAGAKFLIDLGAQTSVLDGNSLSYDKYKQVRALGKRSSDPYCDAVGTMYAPVNIKDPDNTQSTWTLVAETYSNGLLTSSNTTNSAVQVVTLSAGTYSLAGVVGNTDSGHTSQLVVSAATDGVVLTQVNTSAPIGSTIAIDESTSKFTLLASSQAVTFTASVVTTAAGNAGAVGSATLRFILEADTALSYPVAGQQ